jgi:hypothetical protein
LAPTYMVAAEFIGPSPMAHDVQLSARLRAGRAFEKELRVVGEHRAVI